jgi:hypothetical protein
MALPVARSRDEAHLYMDLQPCRRCGSVEVDWRSALGDDEGAPARRYFGPCAACGTAREFTFRLPDRPDVPGPDDVVFFGGPEPSQLFDPGEWGLIADSCIRDGSAPPTGDPAADAARKRSFAVGVAAYGEILKFIPDGADAVPAAAFRSPHGRAMFEHDPQLFRRDRLARRWEDFRTELEDRFRE